jgi:hypothetical protein
MLEDRKWVAIGAYGAKDENVSSSGHIQIYDWNGSRWNQSGLDLDGEAMDDQSGILVAMLAAGDQVAIGAPDKW